MNKDKNLIRRWDNTPHHANHENFPHHIHTPIGEAEEEVKPGIPMDIFAILDEIEKIINPD